MLYTCMLLVCLVIMCTRAQNADLDVSPTLEQQYHTCNVTGHTVLNTACLRYDWAGYLDIVLLHDIQYVPRAKLVVCGVSHVWVERHLDAHYPVGTLFNCTLKTLNATITLEQSSAFVCNQCILLWLLLFCLT